MEVEATGVMEVEATGVMEVVGGGERGRMEVEARGVMEVEATGVMEVEMAGGTVLSSKSAGAAYLSCGSPPRRMTCGDTRQWAQPPEAIRGRAAPGKRRGSQLADESLTKRRSEGT